jgi:hypothetical protein
MSTVASGTSSQAPGRSDSGSDTTILSSSLICAKRGLSGSSACSVALSAETYSVREWPSLE